MTSLKLKDERGSILLGGLMLVFVITLVGMAIFGLAMSEPRLVASRQNREQAVYTADSGVGVAWQQMANGAPTFATVWGSSLPFTVLPSTQAAPSSGGLSFNYQVLKCTSLYPTGCTVAGGLPDPTSQFAVRSTGTVLRTSDNSTAAQAVVELIFTRTVQNIFNRGIATNTSSSMSGGGGVVDSWDSSQTYPGCPTAPCPYNSTVAGTGGDLFSNGSITFGSSDIIKGGISAVGNIALDGSTVTGDVKSGGNTGVNAGGSTNSISGNVTVGCTVSGSRNCGASDPVANFTTSCTKLPCGTVGGSAKAAGTISDYETVAGGKTPNMGNSLAGPAPVTYPMPADCHVTGTQPGQDNLNRAASGYSSATYVASKVTYSGGSIGVSGSPGNQVARSSDGKFVYTELTGTFSLSGGTVTITSGTAVSLATFCFSAAGVSTGTLAISSSVTSSNPVTIYLTGAAASPVGACAQVPAGHDCHLDLSGGALANNTNDASRLQFYSCAQHSNSSNPCYTTNDYEALSGGSGAYMTVYAPGSNVILSGGSGLGGAIVSNTFSGTGGSDVHYDKNLGNSQNCAICPVTWARVPNTWRATVLP